MSLRLKGAKVLKWLNSTRECGRERRLILRLIEFATGKLFGFVYHLELNGKRILSGDQIASNYTLQPKEFVSALRECLRPMASGEEGLKTQLLLDAARPVSLSP